MTDQPTVAAPENEAQDSTAVLPMHPGHMQAIYQYGYAVALEDAAAFLGDLFDLRAV